MAVYNNNTTGTWFGESTGANTPNLAASRSSFEVYSDGKSFAENFEELFETYKLTNNIDIKRDLGAMVSDRTFMENYKADLLDPIIQGFKTMSENDPHIQSHVDNINRLWDAKVRQYSESASTTAFLPIATLEFPVLTKQFFQSITKDIIEVETVKTPNIAKHVKTTYLVDNVTGDMYEYPKCIFEGTWERIWDAAKGLPFDDQFPIDITPPNGWNINLINFAVNGDPTIPPDPITPGADGKINFAQKLSYAIRIVAIDHNGGVRIPIRGNGITVELSTNGTLVNGNLRFEGIDSGGAVVQVEDLISGRVDFQNGTMSVSSANGLTTAVYVEGYLSNENNERNVSVREVRNLQKFMIEDGPRWNMPFTIEEIEDASALLDINYYNRMVDEIVKTQEMIESQYVLRFLREEHDKYLGVNSNIYNLEGISQEVEVDIAAPGGFAGDPFKYIANAIQFALRAMIHRLTDAAKLDDLSFIIVGNPMATQLISEWTTWRMEQGSSIGGIKVNNSYGFATNMGGNVRVVASNQIQSYTPAPVATTGVRELVLHVYAYPTDPEHISFRHLKYTSHLLATPAQSAYLSQNAHVGGSYNVVTAMSRYKAISIMPLSAKVILLNSDKVYPTP